MQSGRGPARAQPGRGGGSPQAAGWTEARARGADAFTAAGGEEEMAGEQAGIEGGWGLGWAGGRVPEQKWQVPAQAAGKPARTARTETGRRARGWGRLEGEDGAAGTQTARKGGEVVGGGDGARRREGQGS
jgi:hypothetical protein